MQRKVKLANAGNHAGYLIVTAPFSGVITERNVHPGALVSAESKDSKPMLELKEINRLRLQVDIPENLAGTLKVNDTISFYTSAFQEKNIGPYQQEIHECKCPVQI